MNTPPSSASPADDPNLSGLGRVLLESKEGSKPSGPWQPPTAAELHALLREYDIVKMLGRGGMGAVYMGRQKSLDRPVAIKILSAALEESDRGFTERFKNEAKAMAKLNHPGIVSVYDFGEVPGGLLYIVMEYVDGTDVARMIAAKGRLHTEHAMAITAHVCDALAYAHDRGIIHRDIKPANIMVGYDGVVKIADFGLAKMTHNNVIGLTQSGMAMGTLHYMAPEALMLGSAVDHRADIYAVGVMLYQMLTGKIPQGMFKLPSLQIPGLDPRYDAIIAKAIMEDRDARYQSAIEMRRDLDGILTQPVAKVEAEVSRVPAALPTMARPQRPGGQPHRPPQPAPKSSSTGLVTMVVAVVALGIGAYVFFGGSPNSSQGRQTVDEVPEDRAPASAATTATAVAKTPTPITPPPAAPSASLMLGKPAAVIPPVPAPPKVADTVLPLSTESLDLVLDLDFSEKRSYQNLLGANELAEVTAGELARTSGRGGVWYKGPGAFGRFELTDFVCEVEARLVAATGNHAWGIGLVRKEPPTHPWTGVMLRADGKAGAWLYDEGPFMPWTIVPGLALATTKHTLRVEVRGKIVCVFVNGAFIAEREQSRLQPSTLTLYTSGEAGVDLRVARIRVWKLP